MFNTVLNKIKYLLFNTPFYWMTPFSRVFLNKVLIWLSGGRASWYILITKPTRCTNFSILFLEYNSTCFGQFLCPSSGVFHCTHSNGVCHTGFADTSQAVSKTCMTYTIAVCTVKNSRWWTEKLSETCRILFQKWNWEISVSRWVYFLRRYHEEL